MAIISRTVNFGFGTEDGQGTLGSDVGPLNISDEEQDNSIQVLNPPLKGNKILINISSASKNTLPLKIEPVLVEHVPSWKISPNNVYHPEF